MIAASLMTPEIAHSETPEDRIIKYIRGRVAGVNYTGSRITVTWFYTTTNLSQDNITFSVPSSASISSEKDIIFNKARKIGLVDIIISDHVIIKYYADKKDKGYPEVISIKVLDSDFALPSA